MRDAAVFFLVLYFLGGGIALYIGQVDIAVAIWFGFATVMAFLIYAFNDINKQEGRRAMRVMSHINLQFASLEMRMSSEKLRTPQECQESIDENMNNISSY